VDNTVIAALLSMAGMTVLFAAVLAFADKKLRVEEDPKLVEVTHLLPGVNCGACGCLSCHDFAEHLISGESDPVKCRVLAEETRKKIYEALGKEEQEASAVIALVHCVAENKDKKRDAEYTGVKTCAAADLVFGGGLKCQYGCMGYGDCVAVCPFDAIHMFDGLPRVDIKKCTGCGKCAEACPRDIIKMQEKKYEKLIYVACSSHDTLLSTKQACNVGCIACGVCVKLSPKGFFSVEDNLSVADYSKQDDQEGVRAIAPKCPTKVIKET